jgi:hypothetical protein
LKNILGKFLYLEEFLPEIRFSVKNKNTALLRGVDFFLEEYFRKVAFLAEIRFSVKNYNAALLRGVHSS